MHFFRVLWDPSPILTKPYYDEESSEFYTEEKVSKLIKKVFKKHYEGVFPSDVFVIVKKKFLNISNFENYPLKRAKEKIRQLIMLHLPPIKY